MARRTDVGSFLYVSEADKVGVGLIRDMISVVDDESSTITVFATTWLVGSGADEQTRSVEWQLAPRDYAALKEWLNAKRC